MRGTCVLTLDGYSCCTFFIRVPLIQLPLQIAIEAAGRISKEQALGLCSSNLAKLLGIANDIPDMVATEGGDILQSNSKVVAVLTPRRNRVHFVS